MREYQWNVLDDFKRKLFLKFELKRVIFKSIEKNNYVPFVYRYRASYEKGKITRLSTISRQKSRCVFTGRSHGVIRKFAYSRFLIRTESYNGNIPGCRRATW